MTLVSCVVFFSLIVVASASYAEKKYKDMQYKDFKKLPEKPGFKVIEEENLIDKLEKSDLFEKFAEAGGQADAISEEFQDSKYKMYYGNRDKQIRETFTMADADKKKLRSSFLGGAIAEGGDVGEVSVTGTSLAGITDSKSDEKTYSKYNQFKKVPDTYVEYEEYKVYEPKPYKSYDYNPYHGKKYYDEYKMPYDYDKKYYDEYKMPYGYDKKYYDEYKMPYGYDKKYYDEYKTPYGYDKKYYDDEYKYYDEYKMPYDYYKKDYYPTYYPKHYPMGYDYYGKKDYKPYYPYDYGYEYKYGKP